MNMLHHHNRNGKRLQRKSIFGHHLRVRLAALLLCLSVLAGFLPAPVQAADAGEKLSGIVTFQSISLHYAAPDGQPAGEKISDHTLIKKDDKLVLRYTYMITEEQCKGIQAGINYYLDVSPHLVLPDLKDGSALTIKVDEDVTVTFGKIYADGSRAWVTFDAKEDGSGTVLSDYGDLQDAYFYLNCGRAAAVPPDETPIDGSSNLYAMKFENNTQLAFGYAEQEPVTAKAQISKDGSLKDKTITWTIDYTPWQNPSKDDGVTLNTPFELRDTIDSGLHSFIENSVTIDGKPAGSYDSRDKIPQNADTYVLAELSEDGAGTLLTFGGTKFNAVQATKEHPASPLKITYQTSIHDELLLPGGAGGKSITNAADLFAGIDGTFNRLNISSKSTVPVPQPKWLTKTGKTERHTNGTGSTTDWTVTFQPNGFTFDVGSSLTLHDQLPGGSTLVENSVKVNGNPGTAAVGNNNDFTVSPITTDQQTVTVSYQTHVPEDMYESGTNLGNNTAWFTFDYKGSSYSTPKAITPIGSGDGSGTPGTATLVKTNTGYHAASRTIDWTVKINPHQAYLKGGTFTDDLKLGTSCGKDGHTRGLELVGGTDRITVTIDGSAPTDAEKNRIYFTYDQQLLTVKVGEIGAKAITLTYTTKVCDPCIFANNTSNTAFKNVISTKDMMIGRNTTEARSASADSTVKVGAAVLSKKPPVYDYVSGTMKWTVEVNASGLSMDDVVLTDDLPDGLTYVEHSLKISPEIQGASAAAAGRTLKINLGAVSKKTTVTFDTRVDPETLGFDGSGPVVVENTIRMNGRADGVTFTEVSHRVRQNFSNHGLVKSSKTDNQQELIQYEVLINPYQLALPENPSLKDTLDQRLQLDTDTLRFYRAVLTGTTATNTDQKPQYTKKETGQPLKVSGFDPDTNTFTVQLPIDAGSREAYVLTYTADMMEHQAGSYSNSVRFDGGSVLLGGNKNNSAAVGGGGGGGGGGVAARKASITVVKTDRETQAPLSGVTFFLYEWDNDMRGLPFAKGTTDAQGELTFKVKPNAVYELVETESIPGYSSKFGWKHLPGGVRETDSGLLITAGAAKTELKLELTNKADTTDLVFRLVNTFGIPMAGADVKLFTSDPTGQVNPVPAREAVVSPDGTVRFPEIRRGAKYYIRHPDGKMMTIDVPVRTDNEPKVILPDGTTAALKDYQAVVTSTPEQQWELTVKKVITGSTAPLAGATIGLYADASCRTLIASGVSGPDGSITFAGLIKGQDYWLKETAAPNGYELNSNTYEGTEGIPNVIIENTPSPFHPDNPDTPGNPDIPSDPDTPGNPENPGASGEPGSPNKPGNPNKPDTSNKPGGPGNTGIPDTPENPGSEVVFLGGQSIPQTGDHTPLLIIAALLSGMGIVLAAMIVHPFRKLKNRHSGNMVLSLITRKHRPANQNKQEK